MSKILYIGNFAPQTASGQKFSTESHIAKTLENLGHKVYRVQEDEIDGELLASHLDNQFSIHFNPDFVLWTRTWNFPNDKLFLDQCKKLGILTVSCHLDLYAPIERGQQLKNDSFWKTDLIFQPDGAPASKKWFTDLGVKHVEWLPPAVFEDECYMIDPAPEKTIDVAFVGSYGYHPEYPYRQKLVDWLRTEYGDRFRKEGSPESCLRGNDLNRFYQSTKIIIGDSLCKNFNHPYYWSDRVAETTGRGGFIIHPWINGLHQIYKDGVDLRFYEYENFNQLKYLINYYLKDENTSEREQIRLQGHTKTKLFHTYTNRMITMLGIIESHV